MNYQTQIWYNGQCYCFCQPQTSANPTPLTQNDPTVISNLLVNRPLDFARSIYPDVRVVISDGGRLDVLPNYNPSRINVEVRNNVVVKFLGLY